MSEYRVTSVDIPWAEQYSQEHQLPLPEGVGAVIPNPEGSGFIQLPYEQYRAAMGNLAIASDAIAGVPKTEPPYVQGFIDLRRHVADNPAARIEYHSESDQRHHLEDAEGEQ